MVAAVLDWRAVLREDKRAEYLLKPLTMAFLIAAALLLGDGVSTGRWVFTVAALVFSAFGDVFLMLRRERFVAGVGSFLLGHVAYVAAFATLAADAPTFVVGTVVVAMGSALNARMRRGMQEKGMGELAMPVSVYFLAIAAMVTSALVTPFRAGWDAPHAILAIIGGLLFMVSDTLIGWTRFVREMAWGPVTIIVTYHLAQVALLLSLLG